MEGSYQASIVAFLVSRSVTKQGHNFFSSNKQGTMDNYTCTECMGKYTHDNTLCTACGQDFCPNCSSWWYNDSECCDSCTSCTLEDFKDAVKAGMTDEEELAEFVRLYN